MHSEPMVEMTLATKCFGNKVALNDVNLSLPRGSVVGLVGANGAGKTTLLRLMSGVLVPDAGSAHTLGYPVQDLGAEQLRRIGALDQKIQLLGWLTVEQHLDYVAGFYDTWDRELQEMLRAKLQLDLFAKVETLSGGNQQKLALMLALCHRPELILLDEPVSNMDPVVRERTLEYLLETVREQETTVVISSHALRDIEKIVDRVVCLRHGYVRDDAPVDELQERYVEWVVARPSSSTEPIQTIREPYVVHQSGVDTRVQLLVQRGKADLEKFRKTYRVDVVERPASLERILLGLIDSPLRYRNVTDSAAAADLPGSP